MVIKRSKFPKKNLEKKCRRGQVVSVREGEFQVSFNSKEFSVVKESDSNFYEQPYMKGGVLCTYDNQQRESISSVYSLDGRLIFERKD